MKKGEIKTIVKENYGSIVKDGGSCCGPGSTDNAPSCCGQMDCCSSTVVTPDDVSRSIGYSEEDLAIAPEGSNLGLGCGNPVALASLVEGEVVLDLGSGAGFDAFLAAKKVGSGGRVIGVDMTPEMVEKARNNAKKDGYDNVEFRLGEIEDLPVDISSVDAIISNCVINLSPDKEKVFAEAFRVLKPGGRLMVSDIVLLSKLPDMIRDSALAYVGCVSGAVLRDEYMKIIESQGFEDVRIVDQTAFPVEFILSEPTLKEAFQGLKISEKEISDIGGSILSIKVFAKKPN